MFSHTGQPAEEPARLVLILVMQFAEGLSARQAADAVRGRIDWKYVLALDLTDPGFDASILSEFRSRLIHGEAESLLLETLLTLLQERHLLKARGKQRTDSTHILAAIRTLNRLELVGETMRYALNRLAVVAPAWLRAHMQPEWAERYGTRVENYRFPKVDTERQRLASTIGADGFTLLLVSGFTTAATRLIPKGTVSGSAMTAGKPSAMSLPMTFQSGNTSNAYSTWTHWPPARDLS